MEQKAAGNGGFLLPRCVHGPLRSRRPAWRSATCRRRSAAQAPAATAFEGMSLGLELDTGSEEIKELYTDFKALLEDARLEFDKGDVVTAEVYSVDNKGAYVDFGGKQIGWISSAESSLCSNLKASDVFQIGTKQDFIVLGAERMRSEKNPGVTLLSAKAIQEDVAWKRATQFMENDIIVKGIITGFNRGGFVVDVMGLEAFCPFSQANSGVNEPETMVGKELVGKILDCDKENQRFVLSNRRAMAPNPQSDVDFKVGSIISGVVNSIQTYGAFIDVSNGVSGLLHISQITQGRILNVDDVMKKGDKVKVMVLSYDRLRRRVSLSTKKIEPSPGDMLKDPALVYERADEMAQKFREQVALAEKRAEEEEKRLAEAARENM